MIAPFDAVELSVVAEYIAPDRASTIERLHGTDDYQRAQSDGNLARVLFSVYVHRAGLGAECVADCDARDAGQLVAAALAKAHGVPVHDFSFQLGA